MKEKMIKVFHTLLGMSITEILYGIIAAIWNFNPTAIDKFNLKIFATGFILMIVSVFILSIWLKDYNEKK